MKTGRGGVGKPPKGSKRVFEPVFLASAASACWYCSISQARPLRSRRCSAAVASLVAARTKPSPGLNNRTRMARRAAQGSPSRSP